MSEANEPDGKKPLPTCKAILLCDQVILDAISKKTSLLGLFDRFAQVKFPGQARPFWAFLQLVDGIGKYNLSIEVRELTDGETIWNTPPLGIVFPERTNRVNLPFQVQGLPLPHPGVYDFVVLADGRVIDRQRFEAVEIGDQPNVERRPDAPDGNGE